LNDLDAEWCMQCSTRLRPARVAIDYTEGAPQLKEMIGGTLGIVAGPSESTDDGIASAFAVDGDGATWICSRCSHRNDIKASECAKCGRSFVESARWTADTGIVPQKQSRAMLKALGIVSLGAVVMRLVGGLISPWAAFGLLGAAFLRWLVRMFRT
jgi:ribosomal protein L40E